MATDNSLHFGRWWEPIHGMVRDRLKEGDQARESRTGHLKDRQGSRPKADYSTDQNIPKVQHRPQSCRI